MTVPKLDEILISPTLGSGLWDTTGPDPPALCANTSRWAAVQLSLTLVYVSALHSPGFSLAQLAAGPERGGKEGPVLRVCPSSHGGRGSVCFPAQVQAAFYLQEAIPGITLPGYTHSLHIQPRVHGRMSPKGQSDWPSLPCEHGSISYPLGRGAKA